MESIPAISFCRKKDMFELLVWSFHSLTHLCTYLLYMMYIHAHMLIYATYKIQCVCDIAVCPITLIARVC